MRLSPLVLILALTGCMPAVVKEKVVLGHERAKRVSELIDSGTVTFDELKVWAKADLEVWSALREAVE